MAIRNIRVSGDPILRKKSRVVDEITPRILELIEDMKDTMYDRDGVGIAAVQVGVLKRIFIVDVTGDDPYVFINPEIVETRGIQHGMEGCLSVPGKSGNVTRPNYVRVRAINEFNEEFEIEVEELFARAILHENDHLNGELYIDKVDGDLSEEE